MTQVENFTIEWLIPQDVRGGVWLGGRCSGILSFVASGRNRFFCGKSGRVAAARPGAPKLIQF